MPVRRDEAAAAFLEEVAGDEAAQVVSIFNVLVWFVRWPRSASSKARPCYLFQYDMKRSVSVFLSRPGGANRLILFEARTELTL